MKQEFIINVFAENKIGIINHITTVLLCRNMNIESLTTSESSIPGIYKLTISLFTDEEMLQRVVKQLDKKVDVLKAYYHKVDDVIQQEVALFKLSNEKLLDGHNIEALVRKYNVRIMEICAGHTILEKTGHSDDIKELFEVLDKKYTVLQFSRSGIVTVDKENKERLGEYLKTITNKN